MRNEVNWTNSNSNEFQDPVSGDPGRLEFVVEKRIDVLPTDTQLCGTVPLHYSSNCQDPVLDLVIGLW